MTEEAAGLALKYFANAFATQSLYVIGAGASARWTPPTSGFQKLLLDKAVTTGIYHTSTQPKDAITDRLLGDLSKLRYDPNDDKVAMRVELSKLTSPEVHKAHAIEIFSAEVPTDCPEYEVFKYAKCPSLIATFNFDPVLKRIAKYHVVLPMHGEISNQGVFNSNDWDLHIQHLAMFPLRAAIPENLILPSRESDELIKEHCYQTLLKISQLLPLSSHITLIGYSFGNMDDHHMHNFLLRHARETKKPVIVFDLNAETIAIRLREEIGTDQVYAFQCTWHLLSQAIIKSIFIRTHKSCDLGRLCPKCIGWHYCNVTSL